MLKIGMPYLGSKRKIANTIIDYILIKNPKCKYFYDLFGGGGSISFCAVQKPQIKKVFYNELNTAIVLLLKDLLKNGVSDYYYKWIDREFYNENINKDTIIGGLCKTIWSFGNNQKDYLYNKENEINKKLFHNIIVNNDFESLNKINKKFSLNLEMPKIQPRFDFFQNEIKEKRLLIRRELGRIKKLERLQHLEHLQNLQRLQHLERLERLERLGRLGRLGRLEISNFSYDEVFINTPIEETVVYIDPPYLDSAKYQKKINHDKLYNWIDNSKYKIYLSSYKSDLKEVLSIDTITTLGHGIKKVQEKLFVNK